MRIVAIRTWLYRFHFTSEKTVAPDKPAQMEARGLVSWMKQTGIDETVEVLGGDSTSSNTGWAGGCITWIDKLLNRNDYMLPVPEFKVVINSFG